MNHKKTDKSNPLYQSESTTEQITLQLEANLLDWFRKQAPETEKGYETLMVDVIKDYINHCK